jgi:hypothetical protein
MSTPDDYRAMAEECFRWARRAQTEDKRQAYLDVARTWLEAASGQDCGPWAQTPTLWPSLCPQKANLRRVSTRPAPPGRSSLGARRVFG